MAAKKAGAGSAWAAAAARVLLGGVMFYAGFLKLSNVSLFATDIAHYKLLPGVLERFLAVVLPWNEVVVGAMLLLGLWTRAAALLVAAMFGMFAVAVITALYRGLDINCGCLGHASAGPLGYKTLAFEALGMSLALGVYYFSKAAKARRT